MWPEAERKKSDAIFSSLSRAAEYCIGVQLGAVATSSPTTCTAITFTIVIDGNQITLGDMTSELTHAKGSTFVVHFAADEPTLATFKGKTLIWDGQEFTLIK